MLDHMRTNESVHKITTFTKRERVQNMNSMTKFKPINKYIVISKIDEQLKTDSGLLLSQEDAKSFRYMKALVISVGHEVHTVKDGESIYYDKSAGHTLLIGNDPFTVIREADVVVVLDAEVPD